MSSRTVLYVNGFPPRISARDLAYEFERYGRLVRCDIPAPKTSNSRVFAFVEFEDPYDAEHAYRRMHRYRLDGYALDVQWAKHTPSSSWRYEGGAPRRGRSRSRSPARRSYNDSRRDRSRSPPRRGRETDRGRNASRSPVRSRSPLPPPPARERSRSRSPVRSRSRSPVRAQSRSPVRSRSPSRSMSRDRSPSPIGRKSPMETSRSPSPARSHASLDAE